MNSLVKSWLAGFVVLFGVSFLWYTAMAERYDAWDAGVARPEGENFVFIIIGLLVATFVMAYMYPRGYEGGSHVTEGATFGALIGLLVAVGMNMVLYGAYNFSGTGVLVDGIFNLIAFAATGAAIGYMHSSEKIASPAA